MKHTLKTIFPNIIVFVCALASCGPDTAKDSSSLMRESSELPPATSTSSVHVHHWSSDWSADEKGHWHACRDCDEKSDYAAHTSDGTYRYDDATHWYECTICHHKFDEEEHAFTSEDPKEEYLASEATCLEAAKYYKSCKCGAHNEETFSYGEPLAHHFSTEWSYDHDYHYHACTYGCGTVSDKAAHVYDQEVAKLEYLADPATCHSKATYYKSCLCGKAGTETFEYGDFAEHQYSTEWSYDESEHWHQCVYGDKGDEAAHTFGEPVLKSLPTEDNSNAVFESTCSVCGYVKTENKTPLEALNILYAGTKTINGFDKNTLALMRAAGVTKIYAAINPLEVYKAAHDGADPEFAPAQWAIQCEELGWNYVVDGIGTDGTQNIVFDLSSDNILNTGKSLADLTNLRLCLAYHYYDSDSAWQSKPGQAWDLTFSKFIFTHTELTASEAMAVLNSQFNDMTAKKIDGFDTATTTLMHTAGVKKIRVTVDPAKDFSETHGAYNVRLFAKKSVDDWGSGCIENWNYGEATEFTYDVSSIFTDEITLFAFSMLTNDNGTSTRASFWGVTCSNIYFE